MLSKIHVPAHVSLASAVVVIGYAVGTILDPNVAAALSSFPNGVKIVSAAGAALTLLTAFGIPVQNLLAKKSPPQS